MKTQMESPPGATDGQGLDRGANAQSIHKYSTKSSKSQELSLLDFTLQKANYHRAQYIATGDANDFRLALAYQQDRETLLREHLTNRMDGSDRT